MAFLAINILPQYRNVEDSRNGETARLRQEKELAAAQVVNLWPKKGNNQAKSYVFAKLPLQEKSAGKSFRNNFLFRKCLTPHSAIFKYATGSANVLGYQNLEKCLPDGTSKLIVEPNAPYTFSIVRKFRLLKKEHYRFIELICPYLIPKYLN